MNTRARKFTKSFILALFLILPIHSAQSAEISVYKQLGKTFVKLDPLSDRTEDSRELIALVHFIQEPDSFDFNKALTRLNSKHIMPSSSQDKSIVIGNEKANTKIAKNLPIEPETYHSKTVKTPVIVRYVQEQTSRPVYEERYVEVDDSSSDSSSGTAR